MEINDYKDLIVWQKAMELSVHVYSLTVDFPQTEIYGLISQIRRAAVSIPSNIAEGHGRFSDRDFLRFLSIANGSLKEVETQLYLSIRLNYTNETNAKLSLSLCMELTKMIYGLRKKISTRIARQEK